MTTGAEATEGGRDAGASPDRSPEAVFDVLAEFLELVLDAMVGILQLLDAAVRLAQLLFEPVDAHDQRSRLVLVRRGGAGDVGQRRGLRGLSVKQVEALGVRRNGKREDGKRCERRARASSG